MARTATGPGPLAVVLLTGTLMAAPAGSVDAAAAPGVIQREVCSVPGLDRAHGPTQLAGLDLPAVWPLTRGAGQRVAVVGTGVAPHRRLPRLVGGGDFVADGDGRRDCDGTGTVMAGIVAASPDSGADGFSGVAPHSTVIATRYTSTKFTAPDEPAPGTRLLARALRAAADRGATVIVIGECLAADADGRDVAAALDHAVGVQDAVVIAAAGDTGSDCPPRARGGPPGAARPGVLTVGSVGERGAPSSFTRADRPADIAAPGERVFSLSPVGDAVANTVAVGDSAEIGGTGYAAAVVAGVAALVRSRFPELSAEQVCRRLVDTARHPGTRHGSSGAGAGVVDPVAAVGAPSAQGRSPASAATDTTAPPAEPRMDRTEAQTPDETAETADHGRAALIGAGGLLAVLGVSRVLRRPVRRHCGRPARRHG